MRWILIFTVYLLPSTLACSTTTFNSTYDPYPDCAASCLACEDSSYSRNFANNCDYSSGECCTSQHHNVIAETWSCVQTGCGDKVSKEAFDTFVTFCKDQYKPLDEKDVPAGYNLTESGSKGSSKKPLLNTGQIIGIAIGGVTCLATIVGLFIKCCWYGRKKKQPTTGGRDDANHLQLIHQPQRFDLGMAPHIFQGNGDVVATYTKNTSTTSLSHGRTKTKEVFEWRRAHGQVNPSHRVIEEID